jgi:hypothetical protein
MSDVSLVRAALAHGVAGPLPVLNFACSLLGREARGPAAAPLASVTDLPGRERAAVQAPTLRRAG